MENGGAVLLSRVFRPRIIREKVARNTVRYTDPRVPHRPRRVAMAAIVNPHVLQSCAIADDVPGIVQIAHRLALDPARDHERIVRNPRYSSQDLHGSRRQGDRPGASWGRSWYREGGARLPPCPPDPREDSRSRPCGSRSAAADAWPPPRAPKPPCRSPTRRAPGRAAGTPRRSGTARACAPCT